MSKKVRTLLVDMRYQGVLSEEDIIKLIKVNFSESKFANYLEGLPKIKRYEKNRKRIPFLRAEP
ncbi:hypothetical protein [Taylorella equigenitalis]|uniref:Uncharacterized protein n=3 Tax=Taylorella equigenitalis TaxID=29575 RepID=A0A654KGK1_TAYEM|nr:hypothetical protein [Taylorella equigenitalis]ADU91519.1 hypothetical protein TEQUI_0577 [Taylorella equigenitalis MCE9]AFN36602.1 hypothetical protein KUI_1560 [Taylorella equigenitalis ATCC 35865]ASY38465.1 hypothetical protein CA605_07335 [Taylorella equigenitalis]ASY40002.1 hypothetical protein CA604_07855 [Taylorella equigenitalis]ASY41445.1 hypothetical protein CAV20_07280 [Taylorella equigenitalis]